MNQIVWRRRNRGRASREAPTQRLNLRESQAFVLHAKHELEICVF